MTSTLLHIDASARTEGSVTRALSARIVDHFGAETVIRRDLTDSLPHVSESWIGANFTPSSERSEAQARQLALSDSLVAELQRADTIVIGTPIYNFGVPASLKAWIDMICRVGMTFEYTPNGPRGLLEGKRVVIAMASGGTKLGSEIDFASGYLRHICGFIGVSDVEIIAADALSANQDSAIAAAHSKITALAA